MTDSAVKFAGNRRIHIGLHVSNVDRSRGFYQTLLDAVPTKTRAGYARFETTDPPLNLSIIQADAEIQTDLSTGPASATSHYGIQVKSLSAVDAVRKRLASAGLVTKVEESVTCCHAVQDKIWVEDPDGHRWEVFVVLDDAPTTPASAESQECCPTSGSEADCCNDSEEACC